MQNTRNYRTSAKNHLTITSGLDEIIIGSMLGDLSAEKPSIKHNTRLQFRQSEINKEYIYHLYSLYKDFCKSKPKVNTYKDKRPGKELNISIKF